MGRKKARSKRKKQPEWELDDEHRLLGCLDCHLERGTSDRKTLIEAISRYLQGAIGKEFSVEQIDARLQQMQAIAAQEKRRQSIFTKGSHVLKKIAPWDENAISKYKEGIRDLIIATIIHSDGRHLRGTPQRMQREHTRGPTSVTPTPSKRKLESDTTSIQRPAVGVHTSKKRRERHRLTGLRPDELKQEPSSTRENSRVPDHDKIVPDSDGHSEGLDDEDVYLLQVPHCRGEQGSETKTERRLKQELEVLQKKHYTLELRLQEVVNMHIHATRELAEVRAKYVTATEFAVASERALSEMDQSRGTESTEKIAYQERKLASLGNLLRNTRNSASFACLPSETAFGPSEVDIQKAMTKIHAEIRKLVPPPYADRTIQIPKLNNTIDDGLLSLLRRSSGLCQNDHAAIQSFAADLEQLGLETTVCTLTAAALCDWVFGDDFESDAARPSFLLDMYQHHVCLTDGDLALRNLDLAARSSFFKSEDYLNIQIPCRAETLANRLTNVIAALLETADLNEEERQEVYEGLVDIFKLVLTLKADLVASSGRYTAVLFSPGSDFLVRWMDAESKEGFQRKDVTKESARVQLCILPAIFAYNEGNMKLPAYHFPVSSSLGDKPDMHLVHKAVVII
ncbi:hypothetical protein FE257_008810 [Aspergillus nanangensis]|uniref:Uncharacterized protein n=1 Tax=Aspergillus nanangensis TaxID=2582783 RepID=A0AAD4CKQ9_ASPNN|nr:hypothetical protein FE257_008810 [Aspergillus nanangensis]